MFSHALLISTYASYLIFHSSLLVSVPGLELPPEVQKTAFERNLSVFFQDYDIEKDPTLIAPDVAAHAALAIDVSSGAVLFKQAAHEKLPIASITKLMTVLLTLEAADLDELVTISEKAAATEGSKIWLLAGDRMSVRDLAKAALIHSANDAAYALAEYVGGTQEKFVEQMNNKALQLGLGSTHFANAVGFDDEENYASAFELSVLARELWKNEFFRDVVRIQETVIYSEGGSDYSLESTNDLLDSYLDIYGIKTGTTDAAGQSLVTIGKVDGGHEIMVVVLNSPDRFAESKVIYDWVERAFTWK